MPESLREVASNVQETMFASLNTMTEDMLKSVRSLVKAISAHTRDETMKKIVVLVENEDCLQEANRPIVDNILECRAAADTYASFKAFDSKSAQANGLVKALMAAKANTGSLTLEISNVIDKVNKALTDPEVNATLDACGRVLGNLTGLQSMFRDLKDGESRES